MDVKLLNLGRETIRPLPTEQVADRLRHLLRDAAMRGAGSRHNELAEAVQLALVRLLIRRDNSNAELRKTAELGLLQTALAALMALEQIETEQQDAQRDSDHVFVHEWRKS